MMFEPHFWTTLCGSFPHTDSSAICRRVAADLDVPAWPQLPRYSFRENMYTQYSASLPHLSVDEANEKITFDTTGDLTPALEQFYEQYLAEDLAAFALPPAYAAGFYDMLELLPHQPGHWVKGQVTGPISFGLTVTDQSLRASLYHDALADVIVKNAAMNARWQAQQLSRVRPNVVIFVDEPYMASFGSAYINLSREAVIGMLDEVFEAIHADNALAGVHCCANTDWGVLLATSVDILNLDAYGYLDNLALYPAELRTFLDRGGVLAWGIVPNNEEIFKVTPTGLAERLVQGLGQISERAQRRGITLQPEEFFKRSLIMPSCGLGSTSVEVAERVLEVLVETGLVLRSQCS